MKFPKFININDLIFSPIIRRYRRWNRRLTLTKRQQFVLITFILTSGMLFTQIISSDYRYIMVAILSVITYFASAFALREDLDGVEWLTLLVLPTAFTAGVGVFYFLLPIRWLTRIPFAVVYAVAMYALLLTENIYNVAANHTIALLRAAHTVGFLLTLVVFFLLTETVLSLRNYPIYNVLFIIPIALLLSVQILWSVTLESELSRRVWELSIVVTSVISQIMWITSFWPANLTIKALFITTCFYGISGMAQQYLMEKLYKRTAVEFLSVVVVVLFIFIISTKWRGNF
jgi:hypothetical protein